MTRKSSLKMQKFFTFPNVISRRQCVTPPRAPCRDASGDDGDVDDDPVHVIVIVSLVVGNGATRLVCETQDDAADVETTTSKRRRRRRWEEETPGVVVVGE